MNHPTVHVQCHHGDALTLLPTFDSESVSSIVTDPPYEIGFGGARWDMTGIANSITLWQACLRVLKPGGYLLAFGSPRTHHRMMCAIEDAGFEIRDCLGWMYGCLSDDTEILTDRGWERNSREILNRRVLCFEPETGRFSYARPSNYYNYPNQHTAYRIYSDSTDQLVSRNHRVLIERAGKLVFETAETLARQQQACVPILETLSNMPHSVSLLDKRTGNMQQVVQQILPTQDIPSEDTDGVAQTYQVRLHCLWQRILVAAATCINTKLFTTMQRKIAYTGGHPICSFGSPSMDRKVVNKFSHAVPDSNGSGASYQSRPTGQPRRESDVICHQWKAQTIRMEPVIITPVEYVGNVWCVTVPTGAFVARRNGKVFITGNSGFPKSLDIGKAIDKQAGHTRKSESIPNMKNKVWKGMGGGEWGAPSEPPVTVAAKQWDGWGTALKPAWEPVVMARKPLDGTVAYNILTHGTGGLNIDACRISGETDPISDKGRWPANILHDGSDEVLSMFPETGTSAGGRIGKKASSSVNNVPAGEYYAGDPGYGDSGSAARFFYCAKVSRREREAGCESLPAKTAGEITGRKDGSVGLDSPRAGAGRRAKPSYRLKDDVSAEVRKRIAALLNQTS